MNAFAKLLALSSVLIALGFATPALAAPKIQHTPPTPTAEGDLVIHAKITAEGGVLKPYLYFRKAGGGEYTPVALKAQAHDRFEARVPADFLSGATEVEYYLAAFAGKDLEQGFWRSKEEPYRLNLKVEHNRKLLVSTTPPGAIIDMDGETVGPSPYSSALNPGPHHVTARLAGFAKLDFDFTMPKEKDLELPLTLLPESAAPAAQPKIAQAAPADPPVAAADPRPVPPKNGNGQLHILTVPPGASISVDGEECGNSPLLLELPPGDHIVSARLEDYKDFGSVLKVSPGEEAEKTFKLRAAK